MKAEEIKGTFIERIQRTPTVASFRFLLDRKIDFIPGQFMEVIFDRQDKNMSHYLSFSSSAQRDYIEFTKRISESKFSRKLESLKKSDEVLFNLPLGNCVYKNEYKKVGFLTGGIGITPVISMLEHIEDKKIDADILLIYPNRSPEEIAFKKELDNWRNRLKMRVIYTVSEGVSIRKDIYSGVPDEGFLSRYQRDIQERIFFVFGPPKMVVAMEGLLLKLGLKKENLRTEQFIGY